MNGAFPQGDAHNTSEWTSESFNKINSEKYLKPHIDRRLGRRGLSGEATDD
jgi:hypothetical protein